MKPQGPVAAVALAALAGVAGLWLAAVPGPWLFAFSAVAVAGGALALRPGPPWRRIAGALAVAAPALFILVVGRQSEHLAGSPADPAAQAAFLLAAAFLLGLLAFHWLRPDAWPRSEAGRAAITVGIAALAAGLVAGGSLTVGEEALPAASYDVPPDLVHRVVMRDHQFVPRDPVLPAGKLIEFVVVNEDDAFHTLTYDLNATRHNHDVPAGATVRFLARFDQPGTLHYWCEPHHHANMLGNIQVVAAP